MLEKLKEITIGIVITLFFFFKPFAWFGKKDKSKAGGVGLATPPSGDRVGWKGAASVPERGARHEIGDCRTESGTARGCWRVGPGHGSDAAQETWN